MEEIEAEKAAARARYQQEFEHEEKRIFRELCAQRQVPIPEDERTMTKIVEEAFDTDSDQGVRLLETAEQATRDTMVLLYKRRREAMLAASVATETAAAPAAPTEQPTATELLEHPIEAGSPLAQGVPPLSKTQLTT